MMKNQIYHSRTKHFKIHHHYIKEQVQNKEIKLLYCMSKEQVADIFTKALSKDEF